MNYKAQYEAARDKIGRFHPSEFIPCTEEDIKALGDLYSNLKLPKSYVDFLRVGGRGWAKFQPLTTFLYKSIYQRNKSFQNGEGMNGM